jgi:hypothetical protein
LSLASKYQIETLSLEKHNILLYEKNTRRFQWGVGQVLDSPELKSQDSVFGLNFFVG